MPAAITAGGMDTTEGAAVVADYIVNSFTGWCESYILQNDPLKISKMAD